MSNHNHYTSYNKMAMPNVADEVEATVGLVETEEQVELELEPEQIVEAVSEAIAADFTPTNPEPKTGIVTANKLNIRKLPALNAEVVAVVDKNTKLMIDPEYETVEWFKVCTAAGVEGYCMKKFVEVK